jgi:hypothetical protein
MLTSGADLGAVHARAVVYDNRVEHLWTYAQVASAMMMSIAHGSNDGTHALGYPCNPKPLLTEKSQLRTPSVLGLLATTHTQAGRLPLLPTPPSGSLLLPVFCLGLASGVRFTCQTNVQPLLILRLVYGYHVMRSLGNKITQVSPTRGFAMELGAAITVLLASRLGLPVVSDDLQYVNRNSR